LGKVKILIVLFFRKVRYKTFFEEKQETILYTGVLDPDPVKVVIILSAGSGSGRICNY